MSAIGEQTRSFGEREEMIGELLTPVDEALGRLICSKK
jgi:hypothetical protein